MASQIRTDSTQALKAFWANQDTFATVLITLFIDTYGVDALEWDPATIQMEVEQDFGVDLPAINFEKLMVAASLLTTDSFFVSLPDFARDCIVLAGHEPVPNLLILPDCMDLAWGITESLFINPPEETNENPFNEEIIGYIGKSLDSEGILNPPDILRLATKNQELVNRVNYDYSDDPEMFSAITQMEESKAGDINYAVKSRIHALLIQLQSVPLQTGSTEALVHKLLGGLSKDKALPD